MKKKLNEASIINELKGSSLFFTPPPLTPEKQAVEPSVKTDKSTTIFEKPDTVIPRHHDTVPSRYHDTIQTVRKAVKEIGKEAATHRFTVQEKNALAELIYLYRQQGIKTTENEIARIALNYLIADYRQSGKESILEQVLRELIA